ncbi:MAG: hypothetical protein EHM79_00365 [Geobacter sp.]|nr:MAG: hypothetical protein EHM79_00365 [Geobacter sp.]
MGNGYKYTSPENWASDKGDMYSQNYHYKYHDNLDLKPGSELHERIVRHVMERAQASYDVISKKFSTFEQMDRVVTAYIPADESTDTKDVGEDTDKTVKTVIVPVSYAILETMLSQVVTAFLDLPMMRYAGEGDKAIVKAALMEKVVERQCVLNKIGLPIHTAGRDSLLYGFGPVVPSWMIRTGKRVVTYEEPTGLGETFDIYSALGLEPEAAPTGKLGRRLEEGTLWEGNELTAIDPYLYLPDVSVGIEEPNKGERVGWIGRENLVSLRQEETQKDSDLINIKYLQHYPARGVSTSSIILNDRYKRDEKHGITEEDHATTVDTNFDVVYSFQRLIPKYWNLGSGTKPEIWMFAVACDCVLIKAKPLEFPYDSEIPVKVLAPEFDGHSILPTSRIEINYGMQDTVDFLYSSHMENVKRAINDMLIYDPSVLVSSDILKPGAGKRIRMRRSAWGIKDARSSIFQVPAQDFTRNHLSDAMLSVDLMYRATPASETRQGNIRKQGERVSAAEVQSTQMGSFTRIDRSIKIASMQVMQDLARLFCWSTQWRMSQSVWVSLTGRYEKQLRAEYGEETTGMNVQPADLVADIMAIPHSLPSSYIDNPKWWIELSKMAFTQPELVRKLSSVRIWLHLARTLGARNADEFQRTELETQVVDDETAMLEAQRGNIKPLPGS